MKEKGLDNVGNRVTVALPSRELTGHVVVDGHDLLDIVWTDKALLPTVQAATT